MAKSSATEPLATLKAAYRWLSKPLRIDAAHNAVTFDLRGHQALTARLRNTIARLTNHRGAK